MRPPLFALPTTPGAAISVTRRLYRNGDSEYRINDRRCRLRDVQDLLAAASIGARTYAVIEQDRVHALLNARPRERREILEEAAGILGFKARRRAAELKLESSELNLARLRDLVLEIRRQANALKRQAARARRYRRTTDEIMRRRRILVHAALDDLRRQAARLAEDRATLSAEESGAAAALARVDATLEGFRAHLEDEGRAAGRSRDDLHAREREADRLQAAIATQQERAGEARDAAARQRREAGDLRSRAAAATAAAADGRQASSTAEAEAERQSTAVVALEARYTDLLAAADEAARVAEGAQAELIEALGRVSEAGHRATRAREAGSRLAAQRRRLMAEREGAEIEDRDLATRVAESGARQAQAAVAADATRAACDGVATRRAEAAGRVEQARDRLSAAERDWEAARERRDALASLWRERVTGRAATGIGQALGEDVEVDAAWEGAAGAWLGDLLEARLVDSVEEALRVAASRRSAPGGELRLVVRELLGDAGGGGLLGQLRGAPERLRLLARAAGDPELAADLPAAIEGWRRAPGRAHVTPDGEGVTASGVIVTGSGGAADGGLLACNRRRREAEIELLAAAEGRPRLEAELAAARAGLEVEEAALLEVQQAREAADRQVLEARLGSERDREEKARVARRLAVLAEEDVALSREEDETRRDAESSATLLDAADERRRRAAAAVEEAQALLEGKRRVLEGLASERADGRAHLAARQAAVVSLREQVARLAEEGRLADEDAARRDGEATERDSRAAESMAAAAAHAIELQSVVAEVMALRQRCAAEELALEEIRVRLGAAETEGRQCRATLDAVRARVAGLQVDQARLEAQSAHLDEQCRRDFGCEPGELAAGLQPGDETADLDATRAEVERLEQARDRLGAVNLVALEDLATVEGRYRELLGQQSDIESSIRSLRASIQRIDRTSRERFLESFEAIRERFQKTFQDLFQGGRADLRLLEPDDPLESGVDIIAQPPGKRTESISLLSGGEKALSALALLFAIFRYRPSPFCLLDEVDAPLDEANVDRFARLLRDYGRETQFIIITHNRRSMEAADALYGVTMEEPGVTQMVSMTLS